MARTKIDRSAFLYLEDKSNKQCDQCCFFTPEHRCSVITGHPHVEPKWSCGVFVPGKYNGKPTGGEVTLAEAGLVKHQVRCENCEFADDGKCGLYKMLNGRLPNVFELNETIKPFACCNAMQPGKGKVVVRADGGRVDDATPGLVTPGNIDLMHRPVVHNSDGSISTIRSMSFSDGNREVLVPTVADDGSGILSNEDAVAQYRRTGQHLGMFSSPDDADRYAQQLHEDQLRIYAPQRAKGGRVVASNINHNPSEAQKRSGAYAKDHVHIAGLPITIENASGSVRRGMGKDGKPWAVRMPSNAHYGYLKKTTGADSDHLDVFVGPHRKAPNVYIIDQVDEKTGRFDEHKIMLFFANERQALSTYEKAFSDGKGKDCVGHVATMPIAQFRRWLESGDTTKPLEPTIKQRADGGAVVFDPQPLGPEQKFLEMPNDRVRHGFDDVEGNKETIWEGGDERRYRNNRNDVLAGRLT